MDPDIYELRARLFQGAAKAVITSPHGTAVSFRFSPLLAEQGTPWDGRGWWLFRGSEYVGIVKRAGQALALRTTERSTTDKIILKAAAILMAGLGGDLRAGYTVESVEP